MAISSTWYIYCVALACLSNSSEALRNRTTSVGRFEVHKSHRLFPSSVITSTTKEMSSMDCAFRCLGFPSCLSYNFKKNADSDGTHVCECVAAHKFNYTQDFQPNVDFDHFTMKNPCSVTPCMNNGSCHPLFDEEDFVCECPPSFNGKRCDVGLRLTNGDHGRLEVAVSGEWGTVCDDFFDLNAAQVVCKQLGYTGAASYDCCAHYGEGDGTILLDDVRCTGLESSIFDCSHNGYGESDCSHPEDVGVTCL